MIAVITLFFSWKVALLPAADDYISFVTFFLVPCGVAFQLPVVLTILVQLRILSAAILKKQRRIAYFALFVFAEIRAGNRSKHRSTGGIGATGSLYEAASWWRYDQSQPAERFQAAGDTRLKENLARNIPVEGARLRESYQPLRVLVRISNSGT